MLRKQQLRRVVGLSVLVLAVAGVLPAAARTFTVNFNGDFEDATPGDGVCNVNVVGAPVCTLRAAVQEANATVASDTITFACGIGTITLRGVFDEIEIEESVDIVGNNRCRPVIDGGTPLAGTDDSIFEVQDGVVRFHNLVLQNGIDNFGDGGCIDIDVGSDRVDVKNVDFLGCEASTGEGGAIDNDSDPLFVTSSLFRGNEAQGDGGAINSEGDGDTRISKSTFNRNNSDSDGGAVIGDEDTNLTVQNSRFTDNQADEEGGAIKSETTGTVVIINNRFIDNTANEGGALCDDGNGSFTQFNNRFRGNIGTDDLTGLQDDICIVD
jgi:predicted outer membrane repeat protein